MRRLLLVIVPALFVAACATAGPLASAPQPAPGGVDSSEGSVGAPPAVGRPVDPAIPRAFDPDRALILTATVSLAAADPWAVSDRVQAIILGIGGDVMGLQQSGGGESRFAQLTVRVPAERFTDALRDIRGIADVEILSSSIEGRDVTEEFVDLKARLVAKQAEEQRYLALLARAEQIDDILRIDQALSQVRTQIEQLTGQINSIEQRTTYSTIVVSVTPSGLAPTDPRAYDPAKTFAQAISALAALFRVVADTAIWALVFGWIPLLGLAVAFALGRTLQRRSAT
ncbi:MAG TPA: DUF4349 domain-containing protein [Candidatus Limnocylindrales bacterium]|nr:DUF4349 domain-containing protein [Candidatus Limnocylindrales bacterium]